MRLPVSALILLAAVAGGAHAQNEVYVCIGENGKKEYRNTGITRGCTRLDVPAVTTIPAPARKPAATGPATPPRAATSPADFPKVDSAAQRARDTDRRQILLDEMRAEEQKLAELKKEFANGEPERRGDERNYAKYLERVAAMRESVGRSEKNLEALKREIANLK